MPLKKSNKKGNDDWEAELGEAVDPVAAALQGAKAADASSNVADEEDVAGAGGLMAALKKNKTKKQKKGKAVEEDHVDGDNSVATNGVNGEDSNHEPAVSHLDLATKAPEEATTDDVFAMETSKGKGGKGKQAKTAEKAMDEADESGQEGGTLKSKKEKGKEKKEKEKQRKKEQVC